MLVKEFHPDMVTQMLMWKQTRYRLLLRFLGANPTDFLRE